MAARRLPGAYPTTRPNPTEGSRGAQGDLVARRRSTATSTSADAAELAAADGDQLLGLFANEEMFQQRPEGQGDEYDPVVPLADMTSKALDVLSRDEDGFFLFVEEEAVDEMSHANNGARMLQAMRALEDAVAVAREYVAEHPDTLLVVTGDHECGGLTVENVDATDESGDGAHDRRREDGPFPVAGSDQPVRPRLDDDRAHRSADAGDRRRTRQRGAGRLLPEHPPARRHAGSAARLSRDDAAAPSSET